MGGRVTGEGRRGHGPVTRAYGPGQGGSFAVGLALLPAIAVSCRAMLDEQRTKLLFAPYHPPAVGIGDVVRCHYRDDEVIV